MLSDQAIQIELDTYNPLIPRPGRISATLFIELTSPAEMEHWLTRLVGVERCVELRIGEGDDAVVVRGQVEDSHAAQLTRDTVTASVHYVHFVFSAADLTRLEKGPVVLAIAHRSYQESTELSAETKAELLRDLRGEN
jgi:hypothetical protein